MLFIATTESVQYLRCYPDVLIMDCTYKTNKLDMPLLYMLGVDNLGHSFTIAICFVGKEVEDNYAKAVQHLVRLYTAFGTPLWPSIIVTDAEKAY